MDSEHDDDRAADLLRLARLYQSRSTQELLEITRGQDGYSDDARAVAAQILHERGADRLRRGPIAPPGERPAVGDRPSGAEDGCHRCGAEAELDSFAFVAARRNGFELAPEAPTGGNGLAWLLIPFRLRGILRVRPRLRDPLRLDLVLCATCQLKLSDSSGRIRREGYVFHPLYQGLTILGYDRILEESLMPWYGFYPGTTDWDYTIP